MAIPNTVGMQRKPTHPGEMLREDFLPDYDLTVAGLAGSLGVSRQYQETVWLTQAQMCELFGRDQSVISRHVRNVFREGEIHEESNMQKVHIERQPG